VRRGRVLGSFAEAAVSGADEDEGGDKRHETENANDGQEGEQREGENRYSNEEGKKGAGVENACEHVGSAAGKEIVGKRR